MVKRNKKGQFVKGSKGFSLWKGKKRENISKENHFNWKGGRWKSRGYIYIKCENHPHANNNGYVFEHRLIMEKHFGRVLLLTEIVHHINGDKQDNRIENLMIFSSHSEHMKQEERKRNKLGRFIGQ